MKKLILLAFAAVMMAGCTQKNRDGSIVLDSYYNEHSADNPHTEIIDSCEYICWNYRMAHKGNCKFCAERRKKELQEIVEQLKDK